MPATHIRAVVREGCNRSYSLGAFPQLRKPTEDERAPLYAELQPLVRRLIRQYGDDAEASRDLEGEIYCRFSAMFDAFDPERGVPIRPYMIRQLTSSVYSFARQGWRRKKREITVDLSSFPALGADYNGALRDPTARWNHKLMMEQIAQRLPEAIWRLPKRQRSVVIWRYYDQRSFEEIAMILDIKVASARSLLRHGLHKLRLQAVDGQLS